MTTAESSPKEDRSILVRKEPPPSAQVPYGDHPDQRADLWQAEYDTGIRVVLLHGGFWRQEHDRRHCWGLAGVLAQRGATVVLPEYRRVGGAGGWRATFDDIENACHDFTTRMPSGEKVVVVGHSAGGQLALWIAATRPPPSTVRVVALAPVADLVEAHRLNLGDGAVAAVLGGSPQEVPERYAEVDPSQLSSPQMPVTLVHGGSDSLVPVALSEGYAAKHPASQIERPECGHFELIDPASECSEVSIRAILDGP